MAVEPRLIAGKIVQLLLLLTVVAGTTPAKAQDAIIIQLQQRLISEKRLADDREIQLLRAQEATRIDLQNRLASARRGGAAARTQVNSLTKQLNDALTRERRLIAGILQKDPASEILIADLQTELSQLAAGASKSTKAALASFGSGNRTGAWPQIEAIGRTGGARDKRIAARLRTIMFQYQDPGVTPEDVRDRWSSAAAADPNNALALAALASAEQYLGNIQAALDALSRAFAVSKTPAARHLIAWQRSATAYTLQKPELMVTLLQEQLIATRALRGTGMPEASRKWLEAQTHVELAKFLSPLGKNAEAAESYTAAVRLYEQLQAEAPAWRFVDDTVANILVLRANTEVQLNRLNEASASYQRAIDLLEPRIASQPSDAAQASQLLAQAYAELCNIKVNREPPANALVVCEKTIEVEKGLPQSARRDYTLARDSAFLASLFWAAGRPDEAKSTFRYSTGLWRQLVAMDPVPVTLLGYAGTLHNFATIDPQICWRDVTAAWKALEEKAPLDYQQQRSARHARIAARAGTGCPPLSNTVPNRNDR
jgi:tetratricopeptide (TPR) repeat protein